MLQEDSKTSTITSLRGLKIAEVVANTDPKAQERILVRVLGVHNLANKSIENSIWAYHCAPFKSSSGDLPDPGDYVWVLFPNERDPMTVVWLGYVRSSFQEDLVGDGFETPEEPDSIVGLNDLPFYNRVEE